MPSADAEDRQGNRNVLGQEDPLYQATREALRVLGVVTRALASPHPETEIGTAIPDPKIRDTALTAARCASVVAIGQKWNQLVR
jgi:hypothetical protein